MSISPASFTLNPFVGAVRNETVPFGALTRAGHGGYLVKDGSGNPLTGATIVTTGTASGFQVSAGGAVTPVTNDAAASEDGKTLVIVDGAVKVVLTISVQADTYHVATDSEIDAAWSAMGGVGGKTVKLRDGVYDGTRNGLFHNRSKSTPTTISTDNRDNVILGQMWVEGTNNLIVDNFKEGNVTLYGPNTDFTLQNCEVAKNNTIDPLGDYSAANPGAPLGVLLAQPGNSNISIIQNDIHDVNLGITAGDTAGFLYIARNSIQNVYEDCMKIGGNATSTIIEDNYLAGVIASGSDLNNPHPDFMQFLGRSGSNYTGIEIRRNVIVHTHQRAAAQGIFLDDMNPGFYYDGAIIEGNVVVNQGGSSVGIRIRQAKDCIVRGNTVVTQKLFGATSNVGINLGEESSAGHNVVKNNATNSLTLIGPATYDNINNIALGAAGATIAYSTAFAGTTFSPTSYVEALAEFAMKPNGPLDVDNSGGPSVGDVGAVGSGYATFPPTLPNATSGSLDGSYVV